MKLKTIVSMLLLGTLCGATAAEPKKVLVVSVTTEFRHSSIETAEKVLQKLADTSKAFTIVDFARQPNVNIPHKPNKPGKPTAPKADADEKATRKYESDLKKYESDLAKYEDAIAKWGPADEEKVKKAQAEWDSELKASMAKLSLENLKNYDGVIFANTTGDLPLPDLEGFINWVKQGHGFVGMHSASDTLHHSKGPRWPYIEMLGGEFETHNAQVSVDAINKDKNHPATKHLGDTFTVFDEIYIIKKYNPSTVHELLVLDQHPNTKAPGHYAVSWCKDLGQGKVFYTSLGHREDVWNPEEKGRKNSKETSEAYQQHILGGIKWALGLEPGDGTPQTK
jgi:type 1 glutamine amidotransferase